MTKDKQKKLEIGIVKKRDISENQAKIIFLSLGSNIGNRKINLEKAMFFLSFNKVDIIKVSSFYETESWPNKNFPKYINIVIKGSTVLSPKKLLKLVKKIEKKIGRKITKKNYPRICDIDILDYNQKSISLNIDDNNLTIPHPRMHCRNFVLLPLFEVERNWFHPIKKVKISRLLSNINNNLRNVKIL